MEEIILLFYSFPFFLILWPMLKICKKFGERFEDGNEDTFITELNLDMYLLDTFLRNS